MIKVKRNGEEIEVENEDQIQDGDERMETQPTKDEEKRFTQKDLNSFLAKEKKTWQKRHDDLQKEFDDYKNSVMSEQQKIEEKFKTKYEELSKGYPEEILELLEDKPYSDRVAYIEKYPVDKNKIIKTPGGKTETNQKNIKPLGTIF